MCSALRNNCDKTLSVLAVRVSFQEFTFDIFEKFFSTMATSQTQTLLHSTSGLIQQVVS